jgi:hypothetical protein
MRNPSEEAAALRGLLDWTDGCTAVVSFNGRAYDVPLLDTRLSMHRMRERFAPRPHLDLLHAARRMWRRRLPGCSLTTLERHELGLVRNEDVPGWLIPYRYFTYQRDGDARGLVGIFRHNALDVLSMVVLAYRLAEHYRLPEHNIRFGRDWASLARVYHRAGARDRALGAWERALDRAGCGEDAAEARCELSFAAKRVGDWERAVQLWRNEVESPAPARLYPFVELAKHHEHRLRDFSGALELARRARQLVSSGAVRPRRPRAIVLAELDHRVERLERRASRAAVQSGTGSRS